MKILGREDSKKPVEEEIHNISKGSGEKSVDAIELKLLKLMTDGSVSNKPQGSKSAELLERVAKVANIRDSLKGDAEKSPFSARLNLVITAADQWIKAKKAEAIRSPQKQ